MPVHPAHLFHEYRENLTMQPEDIRRGSVVPQIVVRQDDVHMDGDVVYNDHWNTDPFSARAPRVSNIEAQVLKGLYNNRSVLRETVRAEAAKYRVLFNQRHQKTRTRAARTIRVAATLGLDIAHVGVELAHEGLYAASDEVFQNATYPGIHDHGNDLINQGLGNNPDYSSFFNNTYHVDVDALHPAPGAEQHLIPSASDIQLRHGFEMLGLVGEPDPLNGLAQAVTQFNNVHIGLGPQTVSAALQGAAVTTSAGLMTATGVGLVRWREAAKAAATPEDLTALLQEQLGAYPTAAESSKFPLRSAHPKLRTLLGEEGLDGYLAARDAADAAMSPYIRELIKMNSDEASKRHIGDSDISLGWFASRRDFENAGARTQVFERSRELLAPTIREYAHLVIAYNRLMKGEVFEASPK